MNEKGLSGLRDFQIHTSFMEIVGRQCMYLCFRKSSEKREGIGMAETMGKTFLGNKVEEGDGVDGRLHEEGSSDDVV